MSGRSKELEQIARQTEKFDSSIDGFDHPMINSWHRMLFEVVGRIQPGSPSYGVAQRILDAIERGELPDKISREEIGEVFHAAGADFERIVIKFIK
ncbi:MAG: hypothetical protein LiPW16_49 [Microgenomates group bacterium LiPW_16]|nr:MAG: hypothetical protein LiPW16_49 [Microgenomates group bacterium LiPW_16]